MLVFKSDMDYCVYLEEDGDDLWISVTNGYCEGFDCIVGNTEEPIDVKACVDNARPQKILCNRQSMTV